MGLVIYKKQHKKKNINIVNTKYLGVIQTGSFGLKALTSGILTSKQVETVRRVIARITKRSCKILIRVFVWHVMLKKICWYLDNNIILFL